MEFENYSAALAAVEAVLEGQNKSLGLEGIWTKCIDLLGGT